MHIVFTVNGKKREADVEPRVLLVDLLRDSGLLSVHQGCDEGRCGACTIIMDGAAVKSCLLFGVQADGSSILTSEGLSSEGGLHPLQEAFSECAAVQCGFCTPGVLMTSYDLLQRSPGLDEASVRKAIEGNICRCTGYSGIVDAILKASRSIRSEG
ncbi:MAG TPA: (2Fe-2S)-binding protein [Conexivisphaerales archaeon]|nr:(2Fe-2S)-binding protein [Conexivisphaerales archaeon]